MKTTSQCHRRPMVRKCLTHSLLALLACHPFQKLSAGQGARAPIAPCGDAQSASCFRSTKFCCPPRTLCVGIVRNLACSADLPQLNQKAMFSHRNGNHRSLGSCTAGNWAVAYQGSSDCRFPYPCLVHRNCLYSYLSSFCPSTLAATRGSLRSPSCPSLPESRRKKSWLRPI